MENKLELKHLVPYLPYGLKVNYTEGMHYGTYSIIDAIDIMGVRIAGIELWVLFQNIKPILRPLSDLKEQIQHMRSQSTIQHVIDYPYDYDELQYITKKEFDFLASNHYDLFGLLHQGLAVPLT